MLRRRGSRTQRHAMTHPLSAALSAALSAFLAAALAAAAIAQPPIPRPQSPPVPEVVMAAAQRLAEARARAAAFDLGSATATDERAPKLLVLLHGATPAPSDGAMPGVPEPDAGTLDFTRFYFGYDFVRRLMGVPQSVGLKTLSGVVLTAQSWSSHGAPDGNNKVRYQQGAREEVLEDRFIVPGDHTGDATPPIAALLTFRDGSKGLMHQTKAIADQVFDAYTRRFGTAAQGVSGRVPPNLIFVGHSMGCIVTRAVLTAPSEPIQGEQLTADQRLRALSLRDRALYVISLAGPHEGSPLADRATNVLDALNDVPAPLADVINGIFDDLIDDVRREARTNLGKDANRDLRTDVWSQLNAGVLAPHRARRGDGTLVPVYTLIGHSPGGDFFVNPLGGDQYPGGGIRLDHLGNEEGRRNAVRSLGLMLVDNLLHNAPGNGPRSWGSTTSGSEFDQVARYHRKALGLTLSAPGEEEGLPFGFPKFYNRDHVTRPGNALLLEPATVVVRTNRDGEVDSDGLVGVKSGHGNRLGTGTDRFFDHGQTWTVAGERERGSWYRLSGEGAPWQFQNHERIHRHHQTGHWLYVNIVSQAGPLVSDDDVSVWPEPPPGAREKAIAAAKAKIRAKRAIRQAIEDPERQPERKD